MERTYLRSVREEPHRPDLLYCHWALLYRSRHRKLALLADYSVRPLTSSVNLDRSTSLYSGAAEIHLILGMCHIPPYLNNSLTAKHLGVRFPAIFLRLIVKSDFVKSAVHSQS